MNEKLRFGEKHVDSIFVWDYTQKRNMKYELQTIWGPNYENDRNVADTLIKKYGLLEEDFWITRELGPYRDKIIYARLLPRHTACIKINSQQKKENKFDISCVSEARGSSEGTVALIYQSVAQGIFEVGEANRVNAGCSYLYGVAKRRLFDKVVTTLTNLYDEGLCSEAGSILPAESTTLKEEVKSTVEQAPPTPESFEERIEKLSRGIAETKTDLNILMDYYGVEDLKELSDEALIHAEGIINDRLEKRRAALAKAAQELSPAGNAQVQAAQDAFPAPAASTEQSVQGQEAPAEAKASVASIPQPEENTSGISPIAAMMVAQANAEPVSTGSTAHAESVDAPIEGSCTEEELLGKTVYTCTEDAPEKFQSLSGQTLEQIGKDTLKPLYSRANAVGRKYVSEQLLGIITTYIS